MTDRQPEATLLRHSRREATVVLIVWALALAWVVGYCYLHGYRHDEDSWVVRQGLARPRGPEDLRLIAGFPDWVFFGIIVPWLACTAVTITFCFFMADDDLGPAQEGAPHEH